MFDAVDPVYVPSLYCPDIAVVVGAVGWDVLVVCVVVGVEEVAAVVLLLGFAPPAGTSYAAITPKTVTITRMAMVFLILVS